MIYRLTCTICGASEYREAPDRRTLNEYLSLKTLCHYGTHPFVHNAKWRSQISVLEHKETKPLPRILSPVWY